MGEGADAAGVVHVDGPSVDDVTAMLRWMLIGLVLLSVVRVELGPISLIPIGAACFGWSAFIGWSESASPTSRTWWACALVSCVAVAAASTSYASATGTVVYVAAWGLAICTFCGAFAATTRALHFGVARRWRQLARASAPTAVLAVATTAYVASVGELRWGRESGLFMSLGRTQFELPRRAWPVAVLGLLPMAALLLCGLALSVATHREANDVAARADERVPSADDRAV